MNIRQQANKALLKGLKIFKCDVPCGVCGYAFRYAKSTICCQCHRERGLKAYHADPEKALAKSRGWRLANLGYYRDYQRARYQREKR